MIKRVKESGDEEIKETEIFALLRLWHRVCMYVCMYVPSSAEKLVHIAANKFVQRNLGNFMAPVDDL